MLASLEELNPDSASGVHTRIRCICHILNLVVKVGLDTIPLTSPSLIMFGLGNFITILGKAKVRGGLTHVGWRGC
jgi:hypothetical protein